MCGDPKMDKADIVRAIHQRKKTKVDMKNLSAVVDEVFEVIYEGLADGKKVDIAGFGAFDLKEAAIKSIDRYMSSNGKAKSKA